jgi:antitoxin HigA-1
MKVVMNEMGNEMTAAAASRPTYRSTTRKAFRCGLACTTIPSRDTNPLSVIRLILSVRVPTSQPPERPGQILREEFIKTGRLTQAALAQRMGVPIAKVRGILSGEEGITAETALLLEAALGVEAEFWIRAQFVWDCYRLREVERRTAVLEHEGKAAKRQKS